jgi:hypothetical protein
MIIYFGKPLGLGRLSVTVAGASLTAPPPGNMLSLKWVFVPEVTLTVQGGGVVALIAI